MNVLLFLFYLLTRMQPYYASFNNSTHIEGELSAVENEIGKLSGTKSN